PHTLSLHDALPISDLQSVDAQLAVDMTAGIAPYCADPPDRTLRQYGAQYLSLGLGQQPAGAVRVQAQRTRALPRCGNSRVVWTFGGEKDRALPGLKMRQRAGYYPLLSRLPRRRVDQARRVKLHRHE